MLQFGCSQYDEAESDAATIRELSLCGGLPGSTLGSEDPLERTLWMKREIFPHTIDLRRWLRRKLSCPHQVDDILQEVFLRLTQTASVAHIENPKGYLWQTAHSVITQRSRPGRSVKAEFVEPETLSHVACHVPLPCRQLEARQKLALVFELLEALPPTTRRILMLRRLEGLSLKATAAAVGLSESAVEKHQLRGHRFLVEQVSQTHN